MDCADKQHADGERSNRQQHDHPTPDHAAELWTA
jgi:hypothetical protein